MPEIPLLMNKTKILDKELKFEGGFVSVYKNHNKSVKQNIRIWSFECKKKKGKREEEAGEMLVQLRTLATLPKKKKNPGSIPSIRMASHRYL